MAGHATTVKLLLDDGAQIDCTDLMKHTPLFRACEMGHTDVVQTLMDCGAKVDVVDQDGRSSTALVSCCKHFTDVKKLCECYLKCAVNYIHTKKNT